MSRPIIVAAIVGFFLSGCVSTTQLYDGPKLSEEEVSVLTMGNQLERDIIVDGDKKFRYKGAVLPGDHNIQIGYYKGFLASGGVGNKNPEGFFSFDVTLKAGRSYYIGTARFSSRVSECDGVAFWIEDIESKEVIAGIRPAKMNLGMINYMFDKLPDYSSTVPNAC